MKLKQLIESTNIPASLVRSTVLQSGGWQYFKERAADIAAHGADAGWTGFTYYNETLPFAKRNKAAILEYGRELAKEMGQDSAYQLIAGFNCLRNSNYTAGDIAAVIHTGKGDDATEIFNALAWFVLIALWPWRLANTPDTQQNSTPLSPPFIAAK